MLLYCQPLFLKLLKKDIKGHSHNINGMPLHSNENQIIVLVGKGFSELELEGFNSKCGFLIS